MGPWSVVGALVTLAGIVGFVAVAQTSGGTTEPSAASWWTAGVAVLIGMAVLAGVARRARRGTAAALLAAAAGLGYAVQAAVTKMFVDVVGDGLGPILASWTTCVLIASALAGFALQQSALKTGSLAPAMAVLAAVVTGVVILAATQPEPR